MAVCAIAVGVLASNAWATFPGRNGIIALPINHIPYVIGIARVPPSASALNMRARNTRFLFGCEINVSLEAQPCYSKAPAPGSVGRPSFSRDGRELVFGNGSGGLNFVGVDGHGLRSLPMLTRSDNNPTWFPNGRLVAFTGGVSPKTGIFSARVDGTGLHRLTSNGDDADVSPHGQFIAFVRRGGHGRSDLWVMRSDGSRGRLLATNGSHPCFSPNGKQIVFASVVRGGASVIERIDLTGRKRTIIAKHGDLPVWSPNGALIAYSETSNDFDLSAQPDLADLWVIPARGGRRKRLAFDNPVSEDSTEFGVPDWQAIPR